MTPAVAPGSSPGEPEGDGVPIGNSTTPPHLSPEETDRILNYVAYVARMVRLDDWRIGLDVDSTEVNGEEEGVSATMHPVEGRLFGRLAVSETFEAELGVRQKSRTLIHEVVHLTHRDAWEQYAQLLFHSGYVPATVTAVLSRLAVDAYEQMVDKWSDALADLLEPFPGPTSVSRSSNVGLLGDV